MLTINIKVDICKWSDTRFFNSQINNSKSSIYILMLLMS